MSMTRSPGALCQVPAAGYETPAVGALERLAMRCVCHLTTEKARPGADLKARKRFSRVADEGLFWFVCSTENDLDELGCDLSDERGRGAHGA